MSFQNSGDYEQSNTERNGGKGPAMTAKARFNLRADEISQEEREKEKVQKRVAM